MAAINYLPAGAESGSEDDDSYYSFGDMANSSNSKLKFVPQEIVKTPLELKKESLLKYLKNNQLADIKQELDHGACKEFDIDEKLDDRWNLLFYACELGLAEILEYLIEERCVNINMTEGGDSAVMVACGSRADSSEVLKVVKILVKHNVNFRATNDYGITAFMNACTNGHVEVVKYLLSINDSFDAIDNLGRNALFHAIDGKNTEIAKILIETGIDLNVSNKFGETPKYYAMNDNNQEIVDLFPADVIKYEPPCRFMSYNRFEDLIPGVTSDDVPAYFPDVVTMLRGMNCDKFISNFAKAEVSLEEFLTVSDERLKEIGIEFPFQRKHILNCLLIFHNEEWTRQSIYVPKDFNEDLTPFNLVMILANVLRQLVIVQTQFVYMKQLGNVIDLKEAYNYIELHNLKELGKKVKTLEAMVKDIIVKDKSTNPLLITKKNKKKMQPKLKTVIKFAAFAAIPVIAFSAFNVSKLFKKI